MIHTGSKNKAIRYSKDLGEKNETEILH